MPYCSHCGAQMPAGTAACPACGQSPLAPAGAQAGAPPRKGMPKSAIVAIVAAVGCLPAIAVVGIIAAILIPNFLDALHTAKQKRTMADMTAIASILESRAVDQPAEGPLYPDVTSIEDLAVELAPYGEIARVDGWKRPFVYACARAAVGVGCNEYRIASAGRDGLFEHEDPWQYEPGSIADHDWDADLILGTEGFVRGP